MTPRFRRRAAAEGGFTLIELLVVFVVIAVLLAIGVSTFTALRGRADVSAAEANVRAALPSIQAYHADRGSYVGMDRAALRAIDPAIRIRIIGAPTATSYCVRNTQPAGVYYYKRGPARPITTTPCTGP